MGNNHSCSKPPLAMMALANQLQLQRFQIVIIRESLLSFADNDGFVHREAFDLALNRAKITDQTAVEIFDLLFTMWDHFGILRIPAIAFVTGIAPLACASDDLKSTLRFSLDISDECNNGKVGRAALHDMLISIDNTAAYFGDAQLEAGDIDNVVEAVFDGGERDIPHELCVRRLLVNAYIKRFVSGRSRSRVQFKSELVTEVQVPVSSIGIVKESTLSQTPVLEEGRLPHESLLSLEAGGSSMTHSECSPIKPRRKLSILQSWSSFESEDSRKPLDPPSVFSFSSRTKNAQFATDQHAALDPPPLRQ